MRSERFDRRELLAPGGSALATSLSGCASAVPSVGGPPEVREESGEIPDRTVPATLVAFSEEAVVTTLAVGDGGASGETVWVWNETGQRREMTVELGGESDPNPWLSGTYGLDSGSGLALDLRTPRNYAIAVGVDGRTETVTVPESQFDCNDSATDVAVRPETIETQTISTTMGCGGLW